MTADRNSDKTCIILLSLFLGKRVWIDGEGVEVEGGVTTQLYKSHNFWNLTDLAFGYIEEKIRKYWSFLAIFMKFHTMALKTFSYPKTTGI